MSNSEIEPHLRDYIGIVKKHIFKLIMFACIIFSPIIAYTFLKSPLYESKLKLEVFTTHRTGYEIDRYDGTETELALQTTVKKLKGKDLLEKVARKLNLNCEILSAPENIDITSLKCDYIFTGEGKQYRNYIVRFKGNTYYVYDSADNEIGHNFSGKQIKQNNWSILISYKGNATEDEMTIRMRDVNYVLEELEEYISVTHFDGTRIIEISVRAEDPVLAADIANKMYELYVENDIAIQKNRLKKGLDFIRIKRDFYRKKLEAAVEREEKIKKDGNISSLADKNRILEEQLSDLKIQIASAEIELEKIRKGILPDEYYFMPLLFDLNYLQGKPEEKDNRTLIIPGKSDARGETKEEALIRFKEKLELSIPHLRNEFKNYQDEIAKIPTIQKKLFEAARDIHFNGKMHDKFQEKYEELKIMYDSTLENTAIVDRPGVFRKPVKPNKILYIAVGFIITLLLSTGFVFLVEYFNNTFHTLEEIEMETGEKLLATIPYTKQNLLNTNEVIGSSDHDSSITEAFKILNSSIEFTGSSEQIRSVEISSSIDGEGKSTIAANLALTAAHFGLKTVLIDADTKNSTLHKIFNTQKEHGFMDIIEGSIICNEAVQDTNVDKLHIITAGHIELNKEHMITSDKISSLLEELKKLYDFVVIDSPPVLLIDDSIRIGRFVDGIIYVVVPGYSEKPVVKQGIERLRKLNLPLLGVCVNDCKNKLNRV